MNKTKVGLPNSCCKCGKDVTAEHWFSEHDDMARSGQGYCIKCVPKPAPKRRAKRKAEPKTKLVTVTDSGEGEEKPVMPDVSPAL